MAAKKARGTTRHRTKPDPLARAVGLRVRKMRLARGWNFDGFVEQVGLGRGYVSELERGLVVPSLHALARIAAALEVTIADVVLGDTPREQLFEVAGSLSDVEVKTVLRDLERRVASKPRT